MRRIALLPLALLAACSTAAPAAAPAAAPMSTSSAAMSGSLTPGTYRSTLAEADLPASLPADQHSGMVGSWDIIVHGPTHAVVNYNGRQVVGAPFTLHGNEIDFSADDEGDYACHSPARYNYARNGNMLRFTLIEDGCQGRVAALTAHPWMMQP